MFKLNICLAFLSTDKHKFIVRKWQNAHILHIIITHIVRVSEILKAQSDL